MSYRYSLAGKKKHTCPNCQKKTFVKYIDNRTGQYLADHIGKCDRADKCGYWNKPEKDYQRATIPDHPKPQPCKKLEVLTVPDHVVKSYAKDGKDYFSTFLINRYGEGAKDVLNRYNVRTSDHYSYEWATVFFQTDYTGVTHAGKVILYNPQTCKRVKKKINGTERAWVNWVHKLNPDLKKNEYQLDQCLFGSHLLKPIWAYDDTPEGYNDFALDSGEPIFIVESEKTAIIAKIHFPQYTFLATGGLTNVNANALLCLLNRKVVLVPDLKIPDKNGKTNVEAWADTFAKKALKAKEGQRFKEIAIPGWLKESCFDFHIFKGLEQIATDAERESGYDLADYLLHAPERVKGLFIELSNCIPISEIQHQKRINIPARKEVANSGADFLSNDPEYWAFFGTHDTFILQSPTGSGKTESAQFACKRDKIPTFVLLPTVEIARQQCASHNGNLLIGGQIWSNADLINAGLSGEVFYSTYEYYSELLRRGVLDHLYDGFYMYIDEAHELENQDNIRSKAVDNIVHLRHPNCRKKVYMTGTVSLTLQQSLGDLPIYRSKIQSKVKLDFNIYTYDSKKATAIISTASRILHMKSETPKDIIVCRINNVKKANELAVRCEKAGYRVAVLFGERNADFIELDDLSKQVKESIQADEIIPEGVDIVICTSIIDTGVNIRNTNIRTVVVHNGHVGYEVYNIYQFFSRFRAVDTLDVNYIISDHALKTENTTGLNALIRAVQDSYNAKVNQYQLEALTLKGSSVSEYFSRNADLINLKPRYRHDGERWQVRTTHAGRECLTEFAKGLTAETALTYMQGEYNCITKAEIKTVKQQTTYFDSSAKDKEALEAVGIIAEWLKDSTYRRYLFTYTIQNGEHDLAKQIAKFEPAYSWNYAKDNIIPTPEYQEFIQKNKHTLAVGCYKARVKQFINYMVHVNHAELSAEWVKEFSDTTKANAQRARVSLATHLFIESEIDLQKAYLRDGRNELERDVMQAILHIAGEFVGKEIECQALWSMVRSKFKDADQYNLTENRICAIIKAGYQFTTRKTKDSYYITLERRTELADVVGTELVSNVKESIRMVVKGVAEKVYKDFPQPVIPPEKAPEPVPCGLETPNPAPEPAREGRFSYGDELLDRYFLE
jgi:hypothetical protein